MSVQLVSVAINQLRHRHQAYRAATAEYIRSTLIEGQRTNVCLRSEDFGSWTAAGGTPTRVAGAHTASGVSLDLLGDDNTGGLERFVRNVTFTGDAVKAISIFLKKGLSPAGSGTRIDLVDTTVGSASRMQMTVTWSVDGVPTVIAGTGTNLRTPVPIGDGVYRFHFRTAAVTAANTNELRVIPAGGSNNNTGDVYAGGVQAENATFPSSYIETTTASVTRSADVLYLPFTAPPQVMTGYFRFLEQGTIDSGDGSRLMQIGLTDATTDPRIYLDVSSSKYRLGHDNGSADVTSVLAAGPSQGQLVELRALLNADGSVQLHQSIEEAAESSAAASAANALAGAWAGERLYLGCDPAGANGGFNAFTHVRFEPGIKTMAEMRVLAGVS